MAKYFFPATQSAHDQHTALFDFVLPTAAAMWNLRWQVKGYLSTVQNATVEQLYSRFAEGSGILGANLRRSCVDHTWDEQKELFARILLVNSIASYEGWLDEALTELDMGKKATSELSKALQFPDSTAKGNKGVVWAIKEITKKESPKLRQAFYLPLSLNRHYSLAKLDAMLLCYRYFKELRNSSMHRGGIANDFLVQAHGHFAGIATSTALGVKEVPEHSIPTAGLRTDLKLRGIIGFTAVVLKIITTLDAELSRSHRAEKSFIKKWISTNPQKQVLPLAGAKRARQVKKLVYNARFPEPAHVQNFGDWLIELGLCRL